MKLYRNDENKRLIASMLQRGREPHSVVITGVKGSGKKELAKYLAAAMLCEKHSGYPCGECRSCLMLEHGNHPDFITVKPNENGNYQLDTVRALVSDAVIKPNEGALKVYVLPDLDRSVSTASAVQNVLLKLIEEPPDHCVIIITAATREIFLPTVLSRVQRFETQPCSVHDAEEWLTMLGRFGQDDIIRAVTCCGGNFGRCIEFLEGSDLPAAYQCARECSDAIIAKDEYQLNKALCSCDGKKAVLRQALVAMTEITRSACLRAMGAEDGGCCYDKGAMKLSQMLGSDTAQRLYELLCDHITKLDGNCNQSLTVNDLSARIAELI